MTLNEYLFGQPEDQKIKIGTTLGAGFFFCGTVEQFCRRAWAYSREALSKLEKSADRAEALLAKAEYSKAVLPEAEVLIDSSKAYMERARRNLEAFKPLGDRDVKETFTACSIADEDTPTIIYIEGTEDGPFWTIKDAERHGEPFFIGLAHQAAIGGRT